jgi:ABC-type oligopeptide transport system substrate-binding subunit
MFLAGQLDMVGVGREQWDSIITPDKELRPDLAAKGIALSKAPQLQIAYVGSTWTIRRGPNRKLRQALSGAFDFDAWREFQNGRVEKPNGRCRRASQAPWKRRAAQLRLGARPAVAGRGGYPEGRDPATGRRLKLTLEIGAADNPEVRQSAELLASFMDRIGVVLGPVQQLAAFLQKIERRQAQMFSVAWLGDYPDAQNFLQLFASETPRRAPTRQLPQRGIRSALSRTRRPCPNRRNARRGARARPWCSRIARGS